MPDYGIVKFQADKNMLSQIVKDFDKIKIQPSICIATFSNEKETRYLIMERDSDMENLMDVLDNHLNDYEILSQKEFSSLNPLLTTFYPDYIIGEISLLEIALRID